MVDNRRHGSLSLLAELGPIRPALVPFWGAVQDIEVNMVILDTVAATAEPPTFVKLDVEGAAPLVLQGATRLLAEARPVITCSYHSDAEHGDVVSILRAQGYGCVEWADDRLVWCSFDSRAGHFVHPLDPRAAAIRDRR